MGRERQRGKGERPPLHPNQPRSLRQNQDLKYRAGTRGGLRSPFPAAQSNAIQIMASGVKLDGRAPRRALETRGGIPFALTWQHLEP